MSSDDEVKFMTELYNAGSVGAGGGSGRPRAAMSAAAIGGRSAATPALINTASESSGDLHAPAAVIALAISRATDALATRTKPRPHINNLTKKFYKATRVLFLVELWRLVTMLDLVVEQCCNIALKIAYRFQENILKTSYLTDESMEGKVVMIAGATNTVGVRIAMDLASRGARLILPCDNLDKGLKLRRKIRRRFEEAVIDVFCMDLDSLESVRAFAHLMKTTEERLDVFINNVENKLVKNKFTDNFLPRLLQVNYFGPTLLMVLLLPLLVRSAPSRILSVSSRSHFFGRIRIREFDGIPTNVYGIAQMFNNIRLANILIVKKLTRVLKNTGVTVNSYHTGKLHRLEYKASLIHRLIFKWTARPVWESARTAIMLACAERLETVSGLYFEECEPVFVSHRASSVPLANRLWNFTYSMIASRLRIKESNRGTPIYMRVLQRKFRVNTV